MKTIITLFLITALSLPLTSAQQKRVASFHKFLIGLNSMRYPRVLAGKIEKIILNGYTKGRRRFDVLKIRVATAIKGMRNKTYTHLLFRRRNFRFKSGEEYLFFATRMNRLSYIDPPHRILGKKIVIDRRSYTFEKVLSWSRSALKSKRRQFLRKNRRFLAVKRTRDRKAGFRLKMIRKEMLLLYKIHKPESLKEKVSLLIELGHTRIRLGEYKKAENAFLYVQRKFRVAPITDLLAARGLALTTFHRKNKNAAINAFRKLLTHPAGASGYRAVLHLDLGRLYETSGKLSRAVKEYTLAASAFPGRHKEQAFARFNLGEVYRKKRQFSRALAEYKKSYLIFNRHLAHAFRKGNARFPTWYFVVKRRITRKGR